MKFDAKKWYIFGSIFIIVTGSLAHFIYEWSGYNSFVGLFVAVNESTWEHIKMAIFGSLLLFIIQYQFFKKENNFYVGSFLSIFSIILLIPIFYYGYQLFIKTSVVIDIFIFIFSIIIGQYTFYKIMKMKDFSKKYITVSIIGILFIVVSYLSFSYFPPHNFLFLDPKTKSYGINPKIQYVQLDEEVVLKEGSSAVVINENIRITVTGFVNSPCPKDTQCIWEGFVVRYDVYQNNEKININESKYKVEIVKSNYKTYAKIKITHN